MDYLPWLVRCVSGCCVEEMADVIINGPYGGGLEAAVNAVLVLF